MNTERAAARTYASAEEESKAFIWKVYGFMSIGLAITGLVSMYLASNESTIWKHFITITPAGRAKLSGLWWGLSILELILVFAFASVVKKVRAHTAALMLGVYAILNGLTLSPIFLIYTKSSIASTFFITGGMFASFSAFGFITKRDLSGVGAICMMAVWGLIIAGFVNYFILHSSNFSFATACVGVVVFAALTAYDTQKIKQLNVLGNAGTEEDTKEALHGALHLYLDFINLFLYLLRLLGNRR